MKISLSKVAQIFLLTTLLIIGGGAVNSSNESLSSSILLILLVVMIFSVSNKAEAGAQDFRISNYSGRTIYRLYVSRSDHSKWEEDVLGKSVFSHGNTIRINFPSSEHGQFWDIKAEFKDGRYWRWSGIDLTRVVSIKIGGDGSIVTESIRC